MTRRVKVPPVIGYVDFEGSGRSRLPERGSAPLNTIAVMAMAHIILFIGQVFPW